MDIIGKSVFIGGIYLVISITYANFPSTKRKMRNLSDQELFQKNEKFKLLGKIFLAAGFFSPIVLISPLFFVPQDRVIDNYLAILVLIAICAIATGMMYLCLTKIIVGEIEYRKNKNHSKES